MLKPLVQIVLVVTALFFFLASNGDAWLLSLVLAAWPFWSLFWFAFRKGVKEYREATERK